MRGRVRACAKRKAVTDLQMRPDKIICQSLEEIDKTPEEYLLETDLSLVSIVLTLVACKNKGNYQSLTCSSLIKMVCFAVWKSSLQEKGSAFTTSATYQGRPHYQSKSNAGNHFDSQRGTVLLCAPYACNGIPHMYHQFKVSVILIF